MLSLLLPSHEQIVNKYKEDVTAFMKEKISNSSGKDPYAAVKVLTEKLRSTDAGEAK